MEQIVDVTVPLHVRDHGGGTIGSSGMYSLRTVEVPQVAEKILHRISERAVEQVGRAKAFFLALRTFRRGQLAVRILY